MPGTRRITAIAISAALCSPGALPEGTKPPAWDITLPHGPVSEVDFETSEGTWMSVDVSPDGRQIVFDLLGDIYCMPVGGGEARLLSGGPALEVQPRFSPDGKRIAFTSDRDGIDNLWTMDADGRNPHQVSREEERQVNNAVWTPDAHYLIGRKHFRNTRSLGAGEMWLYHVSGGGGLQLTKRRNWQQDAGEPSLSPDGRYLYYSEDVSPGGGFQYNKDPYGQIYVIQRLDRETGKAEPFITGNGGSARPEVSPDGKTIAFVRRVGLATALCLHDVESGRERVLYDSLSLDQQEIWAVFGVYPHFAWMPDGASIVIWARGKILRIDTASGRATAIPFRARVKQTVTQALRFNQDMASETFDVRMLRWVTVSPDRKHVAYTALGKIYVRSLPSGKPRRLTSDEEFSEWYPAFSPDGRWIVYAAWNDRQLGSLRTAPVDGGRSKSLLAWKGTYEEPSYSRDGSRIIFRRSGGDELRGELYSRQQGIYWIPAQGGTPTLITEEGSRPMFNQAGDRVFLYSSEGEKRALVSVGLKGEQRRVHLLSEYADEILPSPDEQWVAFAERNQVYVAVFPRTGQAVAIGPSTTDYPLRRLTRDAGEYLSWSGDSKQLYWALGPELFWRDPALTSMVLPTAKDTIPDRPDSIGLNISFRAPSDVPAGTTAFVGASVITMRGEEVLRDATVVVERNRITSVGPRASVVVPPGAFVVDASGKFLIPGLIDVHAHGNFGTIGPQTNWTYYANLVFGVTTMHDPSASTGMVFSNAEMLRSGDLVGPRLFSTGAILYGAEGSAKAVVKTYEDALEHLRRLKAVGAFTVKSYNQPRRDVRQMIVEAARELKMMVVPEGGATYFWNLTHVLDGHTGIEHNIPVAPLYRDAVQLVAHSGTGITPTLIVNYGGLNGEIYWYQHSRVWENERLMTFTPRPMVEARSRRRLMAEESDYSYIETSRSLRDIVRAGGSVQLGAHGQLQGLGAHWELWMLAQGGMTAMEALRCATISGARYIGLDADLGSVEPGKLADLVLLEKDPLQDIRNSEAVRMVMVNGRLYDAWTGDEIGNRPRARGRFWWEEAGH